MADSTRTTVPIDRIETSVWTSGPDEVPERVAAAIADRLVR